MHTLIKHLVLTLLLAVSGQTKAITVFACEPEWAALSKVLLPEATVRTATNHLQDPHHIEARPSLIAQLRGADFAICTGAELESGWLPLLQEKAGNPKVQHGQPTMFYAAQHMDLLDPFKAAITPFSGDVHALGNPHIHADPRRLLKVAVALGARLGSVFPDKKQQVQTNLNKFESELSRKMQEWEKQARGTKGRAVITQHTSFGYLWHWLGITPVADLEPKPGVPPTPSHLDKVLTLSKTHQPIALVIAQHHDPKPARWLASKMAMPNRLLVLPATVTDEQPTAIFRWFDQIIGQLSSVANQP